ncbi:D-glycero-D-manno-heptose 1,7-bisphosphate phosphatase [Lysinibacillus composti]|uniref:D,D-heptose 1,7-bisphosphate phosphatase n=1 Tax=Lysinibacillus composti TaxID=720633 RepID=A0A3N9UHE6_9BACI|nr:HAD family hydrolase [Lysinibacillus composti]MBM7609069.1 D-glycero-D-manno-heptose 1,7-bisphosphate phosphatase [Lysinibacillus composti]RQW75510.1 HAD family hydrolase [Lysinibacillus composti]
MNRALFLDRDGVINIEKNYVHKIEEFEFIDGIFELTKSFQEKGYLIIVITNQAGIGRGYYSEEDFHILNDWMMEQFKQRGINITEVYYCPYHPTHGIGEYKKDSYDRKPNPGMILKARDKYNINLGESFLIGDKESDIQAGKNAGIENTVLFTESNMYSLLNLVQR